MRFMYLRAAFAEKIGMPVPLSWMILAFTALGTFVDWGLGIIGVGVLALYLFCLANSARYRRVIDARSGFVSQKAILTKLQRQIDHLHRTDVDRYHEMISRCDQIMAQQQYETLPGELKQQATGLSRLASFYLQLLVSKTAIENIPGDDDARALATTIASLNQRIKASTSADLTRSLQGQVEILKQRLHAKHEMANRLEYVKSELERIEQQVELLREQTVADTAPRVVSERIDAVTNTLASTSEWMKRNHELLGEVDEMLSEPPPVLQILQQQ